MNYSVVRKKTSSAIKYFFYSSLFSSFNVSGPLSSVALAAPPYLFTGAEFNTPLNEWQGFFGLDSGSGIFGKRTGGFDLVPDKDGILNEQYLFLARIHQEVIAYPLSPWQAEKKRRKKSRVNPSSTEGASSAEGTGSSSEQTTSDYNEPTPLPPAYLSVLNERLAMIGRNRVVELRVAEVIRNDPGGPATVDARLQFLGDHGSTLIYESIMKSTDADEKLSLILDYMTELNAEQRLQWLRAITGALPLVHWPIVMRRLDSETAHQLLPPLPDAMRTQLAELLEMGEAMEVALATVLAIVQDSEGSVSTEENRYFATLDAGELPDNQPPQRSLLLGQEDFQRFIDGGATESEGATERLSLLLSIQSNDSEPDNTAQGYYRAYWKYIVSLMMNRPEYLILTLTALYSTVIGFDHPLRERGIFYVPSSRWLDPVVEELNRQTNWNPIGLGIGSGNGSLEYFLHHRYHLAIEATDAQTIWYEDTVGAHPLSWSFPVVQRDAVEAVRANTRANFLVLSWPSAVDHKANGYGDIIKSFGIDLSKYVEDTDDRRNVSARLGLSDPFYDALVNWGSRGPILFIGEYSEHSVTGSPELRRYLAENYDPISFQKYYQSLPYCHDYPVLYIPKNNQAESAQGGLPETKRPEPEGKGKNRDKSKGKSKKS